VNEQKLQKVEEVPIFACQSSILAAILIEKQNPSLKVTVQNCQSSKGFVEDFCINIIQECVWMVMQFVIK
jgi:hypothetical protein